MKSKMMVLTALAGAFLGSESAQANLVNNGSFADTNLTWTDNTGQGGDLVSPGSNTIPGWTVSTGTNAILWANTPNSYNGITNSPGNTSTFFLDLTGNADSPPYGGVSQSIVTIAGDTYSLTFDLGSSSVYGVQDGITATAGNASQTFTSTNSGTDNNYWETETLNFTASGASTLIDFVGASGHADIGLDNVDVEQTGVSAVPEPSTWAMMILGFCGLGFMAYRRKQSGSTLSVA
jgi:hypothetical protein